MRRPVGCETRLAGRVRLRMNRHERVKQRYSKGITANLGHAAGQQRRGRGLQPMEDDGDWPHTGLTRQRMRRRAGI